MKDIKTSPIFYQGCKKKLIKKGLIDLFPKDIDTFYDLFGGSGIVSMNVKANNYVINDISSQLYDLYNMFKNYDYITIKNNIEDLVLRYDLQKDNVCYDSRSKKYNAKEAEYHKQQYILLRDSYNADKSNIANLYTLLIYCFSHTMRFNSKGDFNMPCGHDKLTDDNKSWIKQGCEFFSKYNVFITNCDYIQSINHDFERGSFLYIDPPYYDTTATYNENNGWNDNNEKTLQYHLETLINKGIKWGMSNSFASKGRINQQLIDWCDKNNLNVTHFDVKYSAMGKGNSNNDEVYICNY